MLDKNKFSSAIGFTDMLFNILVGFSFLFIVAFLLIRPDAKKEDFERKAEYVIVLEWIYMYKTQLILNVILDYL